MIPEPEELKGWKTSDGKIHPLKSDARSHQADLELRNWVNSGEPPMGSADLTLLEWLEANWERIDYLLNVKASGHYTGEE